MLVYLRYMQASSVEVFQLWTALRFCSMGQQMLTTTVPVKLLDLNIVLNNEHVFETVLEHSGRISLVYFCLLRVLFEKVSTCTCTCTNQLKKSYVY